LSSEEAGVFRQKYIKDCRKITTYDENLLKKRNFTLFNMARRSKRKLIIGIMAGIAIVFVLFGASSFFLKNLLWATILLILGITIFLARESIYQALK